MTRSSQQLADHLLGQRLRLFLFPLPGARHKPEQDVALQDVECSGWPCSTYAKEASISAGHLQRC